MKKKIIIFTLIIILLSTFCFGDYTQKGYPDKNYYNSITGFFNTGVSETAFVKNLGDNNLMQPPLSYDYDKDGNNEIIVSDSDNIKIYSGRELDFVTGFSTNHTIEEYSIFTKDDITYMIITENGFVVAPNIRQSVYYYNESTATWTYFSEHRIGANTYRRSTFNCDNVSSYCVAIYEKADSIDYLTFAFNSTDSYIVQSTVKNWDSANNNMCLSSIPDVTFINYDGGNDYEFIFSIGEISTIGANVFDVMVYEIKLNGSGELESNTQILKRNPDFNNGNTCDDYERLFTSPNIMDVDLISPLDIVIGVNVDDDEFKMYSYKIDGTFLDDYPEVFNADGVLISNVVSGTFFPDSEEGKDFCVLGYIETDNHIDLLCASEQKPDILGFFDSDEFNSEINTATFNIDDNTVQHMIHSGQQSTILIDSVDLNEVITPYGVFRITSSNDLEQIFGFAYTDGIISSDEYDNSGRSDLIYLTETALIYIDDNFVNSNAEIDGYIINPCIDFTWKQNTTVGITITPKDSEGDKVQARAILYYGDSNQQDSGWSTAVNSETPIQFTFIANTTIPVGTLRMIARDINHNDTNDTIEISYSVGSEGVSFGDCTTTETDIAEDIEEEAEGVIEEGGIGSPCDTGDDCNCGVCNYGFCGYVNAGEVCDADVCCLSGSCIAGKCTKAGLGAELNESKRELFGGDITTSTIISMIIIICVVGGILWAGGMNNPITVGFAFGMTLLLGITFTLIGWLHIFVTLGLIIMVIIFVVFAFMMGTGGG